MMMNYKSRYAAIALFSGGLDSLLAVKWMQKSGYKVFPVYFLTPYMPIDRALESAAANGIDLIVRDISREHLQMMQDPDVVFGKHMNPCIDCHALMFRIAGDMLDELDAQYLISGEVLGQRPMSQRKDAMNRVANLSGYRDIVVRPLSQKNLRDTKPITENWVDKNDMLDISGRGRYRQLELAEELGIKSFPAPAGGCLLTDRNYSLRLKDLLQYSQTDPKDLEYLKYGRHFRLSPGCKLIIGRDEAENLKIEELIPDTTLKALDITGPLGVISGRCDDPDLLNLALSIFWYYHPKAPNEGNAIINSALGSSTYMCRKADLYTVRKHRLSYD
ncbi:MAG: tRNA (5-methylaminomethyl-2-thiouridylate)-methyltransferase [Candidatus Cloacimonetes bacterium]|jgi:PP-loop superfamily ATP-utilizing enzyme|nr:tRNA (5-methylaminomethyl-2-thiouridylate)-methyltransferase [Candidatus Cloacimonadota bacterium]MDD4148104.1 tRNA (5-methylaminomethyl-2-thiouridylate)-methyltransferase [Candidatus Cloacimonadota bacterium]